MKGNWFDLLGIKGVRLRRVIKDHDLTLRLRRFTDLSVLHALFTPDILLETNRIKPPAPVFGSLVDFWIWLKMAFNVVYLIEVTKKNHSRIIGFAGLYDVKIGQKVWLSLAIFRSQDRKRGYGKRAVELLLKCLRENGAAKKVCVEILRTNVPSLRFFKRLGFRIDRETDERLLLAWQTGERFLLKGMIHNEPISPS